MNDKVRYEDKPWLANYEPGVPESVTYRDISLPQMLHEAAGQFPGRTALLFEGYSVSFRQLNDWVNRFAAFLYASGIRKGDRVAVLLPNLIPCVVSFFSILKVGGIAVMTNPLYTDRELLHQFTDSGVKMLVTLDLLANRMIALRPKTAIRQVIYTTIGDYLPLPKRLLFKVFGKFKKLAATVGPADELYRWKPILTTHGPDIPTEPSTFDEAALYQYTGGTTGVPKGSILTHANISKQVQQLAAWFPSFERGAEVMLGAIPFFHAFGLTTAMVFSLYMGWGCILVPKPQPKTLLKTIRKYRPTFVPLVPTLYIGMLNHPDIQYTDLTSIKGCFSGSAPLPVEVIQAFEAKTGAVIVEGYGLTEASPVTHINPFAGGKRKPGSIGLPIPDTRCRIVDLDDGRTDMPVGEPGELLIQGPQVMKAYWNMPEETRATLQDGWLYTGDIARMDSEGYFNIVDRKKDLIICGGFNVYPRDVEEVLYEHPKVKEACCIGIPHPYRGEAVKVFVALKEGQSATAAELMEHCRGRLAKFKLPEKIEFRTTLPKNNIGKILRKALKSEELSNRQDAPKS